jgi:hypothetical protein
MVNYLPSGQICSSSVEFWPYRPKYTKKSWQHWRLERMRKGVSPGKGVCNEDHANFFPSLELAPSLQPLVCMLAHCFEKLKLIFPEMKLRGLIPNFYIHVSGAICIFPRLVLFRISILHCMRELSAQPQERRGGQGTAANHCLTSSSLPFSPLRRLSREFT